MITLTGRYITNTTDKPLPIYQAGKVSPYDYLKPKETFPLLIDGVAVHNDGKMFAVVSHGLPKTAYIYVGEQSSEGQVVSFVDGLTSSEYKAAGVAKEESKEPVKFLTIAKYLLIVGVAAYAYKTFFKK